MDKFDKANELREKSVKLMQKLENLCEEWRLALFRAKSQRERAEIDKKYEDKVNALKTKEHESYVRYDAYVHKHFRIENIQKATVGGAFMDKTFINRLRKLEKKKERRNERT